ncbi:hypothetical protein H072_7256 [Dactylellina haptotyla CBS 200.50]|uniref:Signal peptidase subunit 3 n=1 Tax=Dactylellina haptotyla (strain CBS 200.50) TaxID=1284197 RepID=S8A7J4_DACHA|nr:hypothetical protein H072_7256 [Dactylellina haptotyla CBS 200.50]
MHSSLVRLQQVFGFLTTVSFALGTLIALTSYLYPMTPTASIKVRDIAVVKRRSGGYYSTRQNEYAKIKFDLNADFDSLYNWNTKQIYVWISTSYGGDRYPTNEMIIWDKIIDKTALSKKITLKNEPAKYNVHDITGAYANRNATLKLSWNVQPHVGVLMWGSASDSVTESFMWPSEKARAAV